MSVTPLKFNKFAGIKDVCDVLETKAPHLRTATNCDINDAGMISRREGYGAPLIAGSYHSLWSDTAQKRMLAVVGSNLVQVDTVNATTRIIRSGFMTGYLMDYCEVNEEIYYTNQQVLGFVTTAGSDGVFPSITKTAGQAMPAGQFLEFHGQRLYSVKGGRIVPSAPLDFGRAVQRKDFLWMPGGITMFKAVSDGIYVSYGNTTIFMQGNRPGDFVIREVADYPAIPYTAFKFDASLVSNNTPLQGTAVFWMSTQGPCIGYQGGQMINLALTKVVPIDGYSGTSVLRKNRKGFMQALSILSN